MGNDQNISEKQIEAAIWYVKHRGLLRKIGLTALIGFDAIVLVYVLFAVGRDVFSIPFRSVQDSELVSSSVPPGAALTARPSDIQLGGVELLQVGEVTDVVARVRNPNAQWYVRFSYTIGIGDKTKRVTDGFLLPDEERPLVYSVRGAGGGNPVFTIDDIKWRRVDSHAISDATQFKSEHLNFEVKDMKFLPGIVEGRGSLSRAQFTLVNKTAYSYVEAKFLVLLYRGAARIGIQSVTVERLDSGQTRKVEVSWTDHIGAVSNVEVVPEIDIFNPEVYSKTGS